MGNLNIAFVGAPGLASEIGKKGTVSDMTFYEVKEGTDSVTLIEPSKYPDKLSSLFYSVQMAEFAVLVVDKIDSFLGETIVMLDSQRKDRGWIVLRNYIQPEQVQPLIKDTCLAGYEFREEDPIAMRIALIEMAKAEKRVAGDGTCGSCPVDSHFNVKGVGTVVLGSVADGWFRIHDKMTVWPVKKEVVLRSIQKHDIDAQDGVKGDHVGLALKGIDSDELDRGFVCSTDPSIKMSPGFTGKVAYNGFWRNPLKEGMMIHVGHWMQMVPAHISAAGDRDSDVTMEFDGQIIHKPGDAAVAMYLEGGKLRVIGTIILP
ncbi:Selenocysteine-specific translation elongation factor [Thermoplasmatales archaeon BRNA1]|nr:Selenocysteine-specific translation elongation factor [Thermoplasmatales archaeon BRNA1]